jgi:RHS repeat-associated protein
LLALYTYGAGIDEPLTMECNGQTYYYHRDALGSVTELSDASGAIVERYEYDVYGAVTIYDADWITRTVSAAGNPYLFTGRRFDPESGNYYYRARVYSPALGRFLSMDPLGFEAGDYNLYCYVFGNPTTMVDPTGLQVPLLPPTPVPEHWLVLHYYKPGEVSVRTEFYPAPVVELPGVGVDVGYRHVKIYEPRLFPPEFRLVEE